MSDYENLHYLVANIFNIGIGYSEEQLINELKDEASNLEFLNQTKSEILKSNNDPDFSWMQLFEMYDGAYFHSEIEARDYAMKILSVFL